jgi:hypothetical protein
VFVKAGLFGLGRIARIQIAFALLALATINPACAGMRLAQSAPPPPPPPQSAKAIEEDSWDWVKDTGNVGLIQTYLDRYPSGVYVGDAQARIAALKAKGACAAPPAAMLSCDVRNAVDAARGFASQAKEMAAAAQAAQTQADDAATKADAGAAGYKVEPVYASSTNRAAIGRYKGQVGTGTDMPQGEGVVAWASGGTYRGQWRDGEPDGAGVDNFATLKITKAGVWRNRSLVLGVISIGEMPAGQESAGQFGDDWANRLDGYGIEREADGTTRIGNWRLGVVNGYSATFDAQGKPVEQGLYFHGALQANSGSQ